MIQIIQTADIVYVQYLENIVNTHRAFHVRGLRVHHKAGKIDMFVKGGAQWNKVPFPLLIMPAANLSYILQRETFTNMSILPHDENQKRLYSPISVKL